MTQITQSEIQPGLVLHLSPSELQKNGAVANCKPGRAVFREGFFVCVSVQNNGSEWIPLFSKKATGSQLISAADKVGHHKWAMKDSFYNPYQVWTIPLLAVQPSAKSDLSTPQKRNRITQNALFLVQKALHPAPTPPPTPLPAPPLAPPPGE